MIRTLDAADIADAMSMPGLVEALREGFAGGIAAPPRQVLDLPNGARQLLVMPALTASGAGVVKIATVFSENATVGHPTIQAAVLLWDEHGGFEAVLDGTTLTRYRTGAASALAATYLARPDARRLLIVGTGALAPYMALGHCAVREYAEVDVWGRDPGKAQATAQAIRALLDPAVVVRAVDHLQGACERADVISSATNAATPLIEGRWLRAGAFVDLVGSFSPHRREADDETMRRSRIFVDTLEGALVEAGDILEPMSRGILQRTDVVGDLSDLATGRVRGRIDEGQVTLFKSVGAALEDLIAARLVLKRARGGPDPERALGGAEGGR